MADMTEAQRSFILALPSDGSWMETHALIDSIHRAHPNGLRGFGNSGLIEGEYKTATRHRLTPIGMGEQRRMTNPAESRLTQEAMK